MIQSQDVSQVPALPLPTSITAERVAATELRPWGSFKCITIGVNTGLLLAVRRR